jgi:type II secretory pathway predicted ATPase ExeA
MFLDYYKLAEQPFGVSPDPRLLYLGSTHREALASLVYGTESDRGFLALIAEPGMGKTCLLYHYLNYLQDKARTAFVFRADCEPRDFIRYILLDLGIDISGMDLPTMHEVLNRLLLEEMQAGRRFVLVIDEAQNLEDKTLESIRLLSNFETPCIKLMLIVLAGQPQLANLLAKPSLAQLRQRIAMVIRLKPFDGDEVNSYIDHRLWVAGSSNASLFTFGARKLIAEYSRGIPRNINTVCFNAMSLGCALRRESIDREIISEVIADLDLAPLMEKNIIANQPESRIEPKCEAATLSDPSKIRSFSGSWIRMFALAGILLLTVASPAGQVRRGESRAGEEPTGAQTSIFTSSIPFRISDPAIPPIEPAHWLNVMPGQTPYRIHADKFNQYEAKVLEGIPSFSPWLRDLEHIQFGQTLRIPLTTITAITAQDTHRAIKQPSSALTARTGKQ